MPDAGPVGETEGFSGTQAARIAGISYRQLDHWARKGVVEPSIAPASGSGSRRRYSYRDLLKLRLAAELRDKARLRLEEIIDVFRYVEDELGQDLTAAGLVIAGRKKVLCRTADEIIDVYRKGQSVMNLVPLAGLASEVDARIRALAPGATEPHRKEPHRTEPAEAPSDSSPARSAIG